MFPGKLISKQDKIWSKLASLYNRKYIWGKVGHLLFFYERIVDLTL